MTAGEAEYVLETELKALAQINAIQAQRIQRAIDALVPSNQIPLTFESDADRQFQTSKILEALRSGAKLNTDLNKICWRYSARIWDLRRQGYTIRTQHIKGNVWEFRLVSE